MPPAKTSPPHLTVVTEADGDCNVAYFTLAAANAPRSIRVMWGDGSVDDSAAFAEGLLAGSDGRYRWQLTHTYSGDGRYQLLAEVDLGTDVPSVITGQGQATVGVQPGRH